MSWCRERDSNPHGHHWPRDFKSLVSTNSTIAASLSKIIGAPFLLHCFSWRLQQVIMWSGKRDSDPRPQPWQGCALPTELFPRTSCGSRLKCDAKVLLFLGNAKSFSAFFAQTAFLVWFWPFFGVAGWLKMRFACQSLLTVSMAPSLRSQTRYSMSRLPPSVQAPMLCSRY